MLLLLWQIIGSDKWRLHHVTAAPSSFPFSAVVNWPKAIKCNHTWYGLVWQSFCLANLSLSLSLSATATKTSPENMSILFVLLCDYFNSLNFYKNGELSRNKKENENSPSCVDVLHKILNLVITRCCFAEDGKEMYQNVKCTCRAIVFAHQTCCFVAFSLPSPATTTRTATATTTLQKQ